MASTSTMNSWIDELSATILPQPSSKRNYKQRRALDTFRRRLRHHNYGRANQFVVSDQLDGLEERFQVLNRDELSDALHERRHELQEYYERWIPDMLDLIIRLSEDPVNKTRLTDLTDTASINETPMLLTWAEIEASDPFDKSDPVWQVPIFSDLSSDEDEVEQSTLESTSPASAIKRTKSIPDATDAHFENVLDTVNLGEARSTLSALRGAASQGGSITELQLVRQMLLVLQGYSSSYFTSHHGELRVNQNFNLHNISVSTLQALVRSLHPVRSSLEVLTSWVDKPTSVTYMQVIKQATEKCMTSYLSAICGLEEQLTDPSSFQVISVLSIATQITELGRAHKVFADYVQQIGHRDSITSLDVLYKFISESTFTNNHPTLDVLVPVFMQAFFEYMKPVDSWIEHGSIVPDLEPFFIRSKQDDSSSKSEKGSIWHSWFDTTSEGPHRPPSFLKPFLNDIFRCGKTIAFINSISPAMASAERHKSDAGIMKDMMRSIYSDRAVLFPQAFTDILADYLSSNLATKTLALRDLLETRCGMNRCLDAFEYIYLRKHGALLDTMENRIFTWIDRCRDNWNDRFLVADMLEDIYSNVECIDLESITVHSAHTSSRSMESRRRSVRILGALAIEYTLPWPVANIISRAATATYRRVALQLLQIRRAKYVLERIAHIQVNSTAISDNPRDQLRAQTTTFMLIQFVNTSYDHFTTGTTLPMTTKMRSDLRTASTVDAMIAVHETYTTNIEFACLTSKQLKMLRETLIGLLDMCIRFADLVSTPSNSAASHHRRGSDDIESGSFRSAYSRRKKERLRARRADAEPISDGDNDDDEEDEPENDGEGYSSFLVLEEDTSVAQELRKLQVQFTRQLDFFVAGLRGVGRGGGTVEEFETLANRLDWKKKL